MSKMNPIIQKAKGLLRKAWCNVDAAWEAAEEANAILRRADRIKAH